MDGQLRLKLQAVCITRVKPFNSVLTAINVENYVFRSVVPTQILKMALSELLATALPWLSRYIPCCSVVAHNPRATKQKSRARSVRTNGRLTDITDVASEKHGPPRTARRPLHQQPDNIDFSSTSAAMPYTWDIAVAIADRRNVPPSFRRADRLTLLKLCKVAGRGGFVDMS